MTTPDHEAPGRDFGDAVTFAWGDLASGRYGLVRLGIIGGEHPNVLALVFEGSDDAIRMTDGVTAEVVTPMEAWCIHGEDLFDLSFTALSAPGRLALELGGVEGYEQLCRVDGTIRGRPVSCLGQRGHEWGVAAWERLQLARTICAWMGEDSALMVTAARPLRAKSHEAETISAVLVDPEPRQVDEARLSTVYDAEDRQRRAGLELWVAEEDEYPRRLAGEAVCGTTVDLGELRLDVAFFRWRMEGREGAGRYDVIRRK